MYSFLKNITLNLFYPLFIVLTSVYTLNCQIAFATDSSATDAISGQGPVVISIKDGKMSADIKKVPLKDVLGKLEKEYGLLYEANEMVLKKEVSVRFDDLPLKEGIDKIVYPLNYLIGIGKKDKQKILFVLDMQLEGDLKPGFDTLQEGSLPEGYTPSDYKILPEYNPDKSDRKAFLTPSPDYKPLPQYTPHEITSGPFVEPPPDYKPLPPYTPHEITSGPFVESSHDSKPLPPFTPHAQANVTSTESNLRE
mgnify:CR=1 FL=1